MADILTVSPGEKDPTKLANAIRQLAERVSGIASSSTFLQVANNLSDLASAATARTNLGLGTSATHASGDYAPSSSAFVTIGNDTALSGERALAAGAGISITDNGANSTVVIANTASTTAATQADQEAASSTTVMVTPGRQQYHPSAPKAWCKWGVTTAIDASYNVSSITDNGTGDWTVNFTTAFSSANYAVALGCEPGSTDITGVGGVIGIKSGGQATGSVRIQAVNTTDAIGSGATSLHDDAKNHVACFGDQP